MTTYPGDFEIKLGFDQIRAKLINYCLGELGAKEINQISFSSNHQAIEVLLRQCDEFKRIIEKGEPFPINNYSDPSVYFEIIRIEDTFLEEENIREVILVLQMVTGAYKVLIKGNEEYPELFVLTKLVTLPTSLISSIEIGRAHV